MSEARSDMTVQ